MQELRQPAFDPDIIRRHLNADMIEAGMRAALDLQARGKLRHTWSVPTPPEEAGTDKGMGHAVPDGPGDPAFETAVIGILGELRDRDLLRRVPNADGRNVREADAWNHFVATGTLRDNTFHSLWKCPIPAALSWGLLSGSMDAIRDFRVAAGLDSYSGSYASERVGAKALMPMGEEHIRPIAEAAAAEALLMGSGQKRHFSSHDITCPKTDERLAWGEDGFLAPVLGKMIWGNRKEGTQTRFEPLESWVEPRVIRHVEITAPSGRILMADWFRIPGFREGIKDPNEFSRTSINSDLGVDVRTKDHYERLGLMRIHTTNCVPRVIREDGLFRVGHLNEDHDDLWIEKEDGHFEANPAVMPEIAGRVCCDVWDVTFADREVLIDIIVAGGRAIEANGGIGDRDRAVPGYVTDREAAGALLDAYVVERDVAVLEVEPGAPLHVYMATGHRLEEFGEEFESPDVMKHDWFEDMFVISDRELQVDPQLLEEAVWSRPDAIFDRAMDSAPEGPEV